MRIPSIPGVDKFKQKTLERLAQKNEKHKVYPIQNSDLLKLKHCPLCKSRQFTIISEVYIEFRLKFFTTATCGKCSFTFRPISPSLSWFNKCWQKIKSKKLEVFKPEEEKARKRRYLQYYNMIKKYHKRGKALDVGAAFGTGADLFRQKGFDVETVEPEINKINYIQKVLEIPVVSKSVEELITKRKSYDVIIFSHCLEHLDRPEQIMPQLRKFLNPGGVLYVEIPLLNSNYITWCDSFYLPHKSNFTKANLAYLARMSGFKIVEQYFDGKFNFGFLLKALPKGVRPLKLKNNNLQSLKHIRGLYRKDWPLTRKPPLNRVLKYSVPYIEQFFQVIKLGNKKLVESETHPGFFSFDSID